MIVQRIGDRGFYFTFDDNISLYLITSTRFYLFCDTHLGPESMVRIQEYMRDHHRPEQMMIFNSHSDWDHIWGNCAFPDSYIIGHETCRTRMIERGEYDLIQNSSQQQGNVLITLPNLTFSNRLVFEDEEIEFFHAPGHTIDCAVCYDKRDGVLYLGDLVEDPIPYLDFGDLDLYLDTLRLIMTHPAGVLVSSHSGIVTRDLIRKNMAYIADIRDCVNLDPSSFGEYERVHTWNLNQRIVLRYESLIRQKMGGEYLPVLLLRQAGDLHDISPGELKKNLGAYLAGISL